MSIDTILVYVDDAAYAQPVLQSMREDLSSPTRWIVVGCAPRVTQHASRWVTSRARESWRGKWADKLFSLLTPLLEGPGNVIMTRLAQHTLQVQTEALVREFGHAQVVDARRPRVDQDLEASQI